MRNLYLGLIFLGILSCVNKEPYDSRFGGYKTSKEILGSELTEHFPDSLIENDFGYSTNFIKNDTLSLCNTCFSASSLILYGQIDSLLFEMLLNQVDTSFIENYNSMDTSILALMDYNDRFEHDGRVFKDLEPKEKKLRSKKNSQIVDKIPVPYFNIENYSNNNSLCNLTENFEIYILKAQAGKNKFSISYDCECLPEKWQHGLLTGYALNRKTRDIIYWTTVW